MANQDNLFFRGRGVDTKDVCVAADAKKTLGKIVEMCEVNVESSWCDTVSHRALVKTE